jgi:hypothetical protein
MGGEIRIERTDGGAIGIDEWRNALRTTLRIRPNESVSVGRNPKTGSEIRVPANPDVAEVNDRGVWVSLISLSDGCGYLYAPPSGAHSADVMRAVFSLAAALHARVIDGRSGEGITAPTAT